MDNFESKMTHKMDKLAVKGEKIAKTSFETLLLSVGINLECARKIMEYIMDASAKVKGKFHSIYEKS